MASTLLAVGETVALQRAIEPGGIVAFYSATCNTDPSNGISVIDLLDDSENILLHMSLRPKDNVIVFNSRLKGAAWGEGETAQFQGAFIPPSFNVTIYDHGDQYQILFSYQTIHYYKKKINGIVSNVTYYVQQDPPIFADVMVLATYKSLEELVLKNKHAISEARPIPKLERYVLIHCLIWATQLIHPKAHIGGCSNHEGYLQPWAWADTTAGEGEEGPSR